MKPSVGRIVHYVSYGSAPDENGFQKFTQQCRAAIITEVVAPEAPIGLCVLNPTGQFFDTDVPFDEGTHRFGIKYATGTLCDHKDHKGGTWHWPARDDA